MGGGARGVGVGRYFETKREGVAKKKVLMNTHARTLWVGGWVVY